MLQSSQPRRPQIHPQAYPPPNPLHQQQIRANSSQPAPLSTHSHYQPTPRSQIEAMPPAAVHAVGPYSLMPFDPARCHPVFFGSTLRKPPFPLFSPAAVTAATGGLANPVAFGYVTENGVKKEGGAKL